jgi:hypothetical protein
VAEAIGGSAGDRAVSFIAESLGLGLPWGAELKVKPSAFEEIAAALLPIVEPYLDDEGDCGERIARLLNGDAADHVVRNLLSRVKALRKSI